LVTSVIFSYHTIYIDDDYAVYKLAAAVKKTSDADFFLKRAMSAPFSIFNSDSGFMEAKFANGSWAEPDAGWTEGDKWAYTFDVVHDVDGLIRAKGGKIEFVRFLDEHFNGGMCILSLVTSRVNIFQDITTTQMRCVYAGIFSKLFANTDI
jgi:putative alpha-1,2-mannosidase